MRFTKMHGAGNDYVYIDCFKEKLPGDIAELARQMSDRNFGIGGDGIILICPSEVADAQMRMFNADGSESEMCGNGLRCVAKYVYDHAICQKTDLKIDTGAGILAAELFISGGLVEKVRINMGEPILTPSEIPTKLPGSQAVDVDLTIGDRTFAVTSVSMGNPHCVVFVDEVTDDWVLNIGPQVEVAPEFPQRVNAEFVKVVSRNELVQRTWERGSGETLACGTGASAVCVAGVLTDRCDRKVLIHLPGGDLELEWNEADNHVYMTGPAVEVFSGVWPDDSND